MFRGLRLRGGCKGKKYKVEGIRGEGRIMYGTFLKYSDICKDQERKLLLQASKSG